MPIGKDKEQEREDDDTVGNISLGQATYLRRFLILTVPLPPTPHSISLKCPLGSLLVDCRIFPSTILPNMRR